MYIHSARLESKVALMSRRAVLTVAAAVDCGSAVGGGAESLTI
eukprot:SAG31_NODE_318_length_17799_cov_79.857571_16_plen_43_part_00